MWKLGKLCAFLDFEYRKKVFRVGFEHMPCSAGAALKTTAPFSNFSNLIFKVQIISKYGYETLI